MKRLLFILGISLFLVGCGEPIETNMSEDVLDFEFTTQDNETLRLEDLEGQYWITDMIFTNCTTVCLPMTANMKTLQERLDEEGFDDIELVSFTVDPDYDTPEVLTDYGKSYDVDFSNWTFLTGYDFDTIKEISIKSFKSPLMEPLEGDDQVTHGTRFYLVNPEGKVVKFYDGVDSTEMEAIVEDVKVVSES